LFSQGTPNAVAVSKWGGLSVTCNSNTDTFYYLTIDASLFGSSTWWNLENCNFQAYYVINIVGTGPVTIQGADFPTITERVIYNFVGSGRTFTTSTGLNGNILAPANTVSQNNGVTRGLIIAGNIPSAIHAQSPNCQKFAPVTITGKTAAAGGNKRSVTGLPVYSFGSFAIGDSITIGGQTVTIIGATEENGVNYFIVDPPISGSFSKDESFSTTIADPSNIVRNPIVVTQATTPNGGTSSDHKDQTSSSSNVVVALYLVALLLALTF